jgi:hypothetical protein
VAVLKFSFTVLGETRDAALEEIDALGREVLSRVSGEPWVSVTDDVKKVPTGTNILDPGNYAYLATQEVVFAGPTVLGDSPSFRDGFRPQEPG